jgi:hypothetical protein
MDAYIVVIPAKARIHSTGNSLKILDSRFHGNDEMGLAETFYGTVKMKSYSYMKKTGINFDYSMRLLQMSKLDKNRSGILPDH